MLVKRGNAQRVCHKVFVRSSKSGNAIKINREQYLRDDILCGSAACSLCAANVVPNAKGDLFPPVLSSDGDFTDKLGPHYTIIDTNIALRAIDVLENISVFNNVIIPQTVLEEVRHRSFPIYSRLRVLTSGGKKHFFVFHNNFCASTYTPRRVTESVNDQNDRAIRRVIQWYNLHLDENARKHPRVVFVSNDQDSLLEARKLMIDAFSLEDYVSLFPGSEQLLDILPQTNKEFSLSKSQDIYEPYLTQSQILAGIKSGFIFQGKFEVSRYNYLAANVKSSAYPRPLLILGRDNMNRAVHGDVVVVELLPKSQWKHPLSVLASENTLNPEEDVADDVLSSPEENLITDDERRLLAKEAKKAQNSTSAEFAVSPTARVVGIIRRNWRFYVGQISSPLMAYQDGTAQRSVLFVPEDKRIPQIRIRSRRVNALMDQRIVVAIEDWPSFSRNPEGHLVRVLGDIENKDVETEAILLEHDIEYRPFPVAAMKCLPPDGHNWKAGGDDPSFGKRSDLRHLLVCSVDPPRCQDIDDALHAHELPNNHYSVGVHIADVSHFVKAGTPLDYEGSIRGTSTYLVDKRIDMLPSLLGTDICSLKPDVDRYAFSVLWELDENAEIVSVQFTKSIIRSVHAFEYEEAQTRIDDVTQQDNLTQSLRILAKLSRKLRKRRLANGALNLASPEVKIFTDTETSDPKSVELKRVVETMSMVEEFMLLANISVAKKIYDAYPQTAILRRHAAPPATNFDVLNDQLRLCGMPKLDVTSSKSLADSLDRIVDPSDQFFNTLIRILATRCMMAAEYFPSGEYSYPEFRHYGLASEIYTHFTSPIRRYADIVAHRQLAGAINFEELHSDHLSKEKLKNVCSNINSRHHDAQLAGRASVEYYVGQALKSMDTLREEGYIIRVFGNGIAVLVPRYGLESVIHLHDICNPDDAELDENNYTLKIKLDDEEKHLKIFDKITVLIRSELNERSSKRQMKMLLI